MGTIHALQHIEQTLTLLVGNHLLTAYIVLFLIVFCETAFLPLFFLPGDPLIFISGAFCATSPLSLWILIPLLVIATVLGSVINYRIGLLLALKFGKKLFSGEYTWLDQAALNKTRLFYEKNGVITFVLSPFIAVVRTFAPFVAGVAGMNLDKFIASVTLGALIWIISLMLGGYFFGNIPLIRNNLATIVLTGLALGLGSLAISSLLKKRQKN